MSKYSTEVEDSCTIKLKVPERTLYFTVAGTEGPKWFFLNGKKMEEYQWVVALMTAYSKHLKNEVILPEIIADMKEVFDPGESILFQMALAEK